MLPRVASTSGTLQPAIAVPADVPADPATRPQPSAAALANLRAEVLLRLLETMLRHMPQGPEANANRSLLEALFSALKAPPASNVGNGGEGGKRLTDLLAKVPAELRPAVEKLIGAALSALPARSLVAILRNPNMPEAQKLASLISAHLDAGAAGDMPPKGAERPQKFVGLTPQQLAAVARHGTQERTGEAPQRMPAGGDARTLQAALKRIFDPDGAPAKRPDSRAAATGGSQPAGANGTRAADASAGETKQPVPRPATATADRTAAQPAAEMTALPDEDKADLPRAGRDEAPAGQTRGADQPRRVVYTVAQAIAREASTEVLIQAITQLVASLSDEDTVLLRSLFNRPLGTATAEQPAGTSMETEAKSGDAEAQARPAGESRRAAEPAPVLAQQRTLPLSEEQQTVARGRTEAAPALAAAVAESAVPAVVLRDGIPPAFVPYLFMEEAVERTEDAQEEEKAESREESENGDENGEGEEDGAEPEAEEGANAESPDMEKRRRKTADMVGVMEPGLVFYQKLGDYWT